MTEETTTETKPRRRVKLDDDALTVTLLAADGSAEQTWDAKKLPDHVRNRCVLVGMWTLIRQMNDFPGEAYADLCAGTLPQERGHGNGKPKLSKWQRAIAAALVEATKKTDAPLSLESAEARVADFTKKQLANARRDPAVVKHYQKQNGGSGLLDLIAG